MSCNCSVSTDIRGRCMPNQIDILYCPARLHTLAWFYANDKRYCNMRNYKKGIREFHYEFVEDAFDLYANSHDERMFIIRSFKYDDLVKTYEEDNADWLKSRPTPRRVFVMDCQKCYNVFKLKKPHMFPVCEDCEEDLPISHLIKSTKKNECPVCYDVSKNLPLQCGHHICKTCEKRIERCPLCRISI